MKKIMFNDKYGLTQAVLSGRKTMTRRVDKRLNHPLVTEISDWGIDDKGKCHLAITYSTGLTEVVYPQYQIGEEVAVAQRYANDDVLAFNAYDSEGQPRKDGHRRHQEMLASPGYRNKMFVKAEYMPHRIRITDIRVERLQDISEEDCLREGIQEYFPYIKRNPNDKVRTFQYFRDGKIRYRQSPAPACFAHLIDRISGKGTWKSNPWVFAYTFELLPGIAAR